MPSGPPKDSPDYREWVAKQVKLSNSPPTLYVNRAVASHGGGFIRLALGDEYGVDAIYRGAFLMTIEDAEDLALLLWEQVQQAKGVSGSGDVQRRP